MVSLCTKFEMPIKIMGSALRKLKMGHMNQPTQLLDPKNGMSFVEVAYK